MRCPKCGYNSFDHLESCKKCGNELGEHKQRYGIKSVLFPGQMKPVSIAETGVDASVVDAAVAAATATATVTAPAIEAEAAGPEAASADGGVEVQANESEDFGFDFMGVG